MMEFNFDRRILPVLPSVSDRALVDKLFDCTSKEISHEMLELESDGRRLMEYEVHRLVAVRYHFLMRSDVKSLMSTLMQREIFAALFDSYGFLPRVKRDRYTGPLAYRTKAKIFLRYVGALGKDDIANAHEWRRSRSPMQAKADNFAHAIYHPSVFPLDAIALAFLETYSDAKKREFRSEIEELTGYRRIMNVERVFMVDNTLEALERESVDLALLSEGAGQ